MQGPFPVRHEFPRLKYLEAGCVFQDTRLDLLSTSLGILTELVKARGETVADRKLRAVSGLTEGSLAVNMSHIRTAFWNATVIDPVKRVRSTNLRKEPGYYLNPDLENFPSPEERDGVLSFGPIRVVPCGGWTYDGQQIHLQAATSSLVLALAQARGGFASKESLYHETGIPNADTLRSQVAKARSAFAKAGGEHLIIKKWDDSQTAAWGYALNMEVV